MPEFKGSSLHHVSVQASPIILYKDLKKKIAEIRVKRDAIMLAHNAVNLHQDKYNKCIICLSLFSAFFESTKAQLDLANRTDWIGPTSILMPILLSTILGIISSLMKFKKFPERMELLSKATEKSNATVLSMRRLSEALNFQPYRQSYNEYSGPVIASYRDALDYYERALYPHEHDKYMKDALKIANSTREREETHDDAIEELLNTDRKERHDNNLSFHNNVQLDTPDDTPNATPEGPTPNVSRPITLQERINSLETDSEDGNNIVIDVEDNLKKKLSSVINNKKISDDIPEATEGINSINSIESKPKTNTDVSHDISSWLSPEVLQKREKNKKLKEKQQQQQQQQQEPEPEPEPEPESEIIGEENL